MSITIMDAILAINPDAKVSIKHDAENHVYDEITDDDHDNFNDIYGHISYEFLIVEPNDQVRSSQIN